MKVEQNKGKLDNVRCLLSLYHPVRVHFHTSLLKKEINTLTENVDNIFNFIAPATEIVCFFD